MKTPKNLDEHWMRLALQEARKGLGKTSPNPAVGAVLVRNGRLLAKGFHRKAGLSHAEIEAMRRAKSLKGATLYVTLEPCCHRNKRTPPCTEAILGSGIRRVVIGSLDPNPAVSGKGARCLKKGGLAVSVGVLEWECRDLNRFYNHWIVFQRPYVILKTAASLDGKIALADGRSKWITGEKSRALVHALRSQVDAVLVGIGTVLADDPELTARARKKQRQPIRVILDPDLKFPLQSRMLKQAKLIPVWILCVHQRRHAAKINRLMRAGAKVFAMKAQKNRMQISAILRFLSDQSIVSLLVEGGGATWTHFFRSRAFQEWQLFLAPKILGADARPMVGDFRLKSIPPDNSLQIAETKTIGEDLFLRLIQQEV